jgi:hypothetical protein
MNLMGKRGPPRCEEYEPVMSLLRRGYFHSLASLARHAGVSAQRIGQWAKEARLDWRERHRLYVEQEWDKTLKRVRRGKVGKRLSKDDLHKMIGLMCEGVPVKRIPPGRRALLDKPE